MDIFKTSLFKFVNGDALVGHPVTMTIRGVEMEKISGPLGEAEKAVCYFIESKKPLILNQGHAKELFASLGRETSAWTGAKIELYSEVGKLKGQPYNAVKIRVIEKPKQLTTAERKERKARNTEELRGPVDDSPIGESPAPEAQPEAAEEFTF
jgi:hypothetical protein